MGLGTILIRADASASIGTGHVMRCLALAQEWRDAGGKAVFAMAESVPGIEAKLAEECCDIVRIAANTSSEDATSTIALARAHAADWMALDGYRFDCSYQLQIKNAGFKLLLVDDVSGDGQFPADIILNQNVHAKEEMYSNRSPYTRCLLGPRFAMLRREFRTVVPHVSRSSNRVLIMMGGSGSASGEILDAVRSIALEGLQITVIAGPGSRDPVTADRSHDGCRLQIIRNPPSVIEYMEWADVALSAAGTTALEMCRVGLPMVLVSVADNQVPGAVELARRGVAVNLGAALEVSPTSITNELWELLCSSEKRRRMSQLGQKLVDGNGATRVVGAMQAMKLRIRPARAEDCGLLWAWANEAGVRAASFHSELIARDEHRDWFARKLAADKTRIYVAEDQCGNALGQFRVEWSTNREASVHVSIAAEKRGLGFGSELIRQAMQIASRETGARRFHAYIKPGNEASLRAFEKAGFSRMETQLDAVHYCLEVTRSNVEEEVLAKIS